MTDDGKIVERIATIETKLKEHDKQLEKQQEKNETQVELNTLLKMQIDLNKEQQVQMNKFGDTIEKVNTNLTSLNETQKQFQSELSVINTRVGAIEESSEKIKIDPMKLFLKILGWSALVVGGIISAYIYKGLGL